jgi:diamine N-acetyltransferase
MDLMVADTPPVSLREITADTVRQIIGLAVAADQQRFVASNAVSLAQALFSAEAWYRAIYAGETPAGFVMLYDESLRGAPPPAPEVGLWRFMVDRRFQGRGIGAAALGQVVAHVRAKGVFSSLTTSYVPGPGCPEQFYLQAGFRHTGKLDEGEVVLELSLVSNPT